MAATLRQAAEATSDVEGLHVNIAVSYGGRHELRDAFRSLLADEATKGTTLAELARTLEIDQIESHLYTAGEPDPDLIIRTSGEQRPSGFLMWQSAHSEFYSARPSGRLPPRRFLRALRTYTQRAALRALRLAPRVSPRRPGLVRSGPRSCDRLRGCGRRWRPPGACPGAAVSRIRVSRR
jgi:undecaprenyl diphosphate synthase